MTFVPTISDLPAVEAPVDGDCTVVDVRLVVAPSAGTFHPAPVHEFTAEGEVIPRGGIVGRIDGPGRSDDVRAFCTGFMVRLLADSGDRVRPGQPLAWLHPFDEPSTEPAG